MSFRYIGSKSRLVDQMGAQARSTAIGTLKHDTFFGDEKESLVVAIAPSVDAQGQIVAQAQALARLGALLTAGAPVPLQVEPNA